MRVGGLLVFGVALALRWVVLHAARQDVLFLEPLRDAEIYDEWARQILRGDWLSLSQGDWYFSPGMAYWMALLYRLFGTQFAVVQASQALLGSLSCLLAFAVGVRLRGLGTGLLAGLLLAGYDLAVFLDCQPLTATPIACLTLLATWLILDGRGGEASASRAFLAGVALGISAWFRPTAALLGGVWAAGLIVLDRPRWTRAGWLLLGLALPLALTAVRNAAVVGMPTTAVTSGGVAFYAGNFRGATGANTFPPFITADPRQQPRAFTAEASRRSGRAFTTREASAYWFHQAIREITAAPGEFLGLLFRKAMLLVNHQELTSNLSLEFARGRVPQFGLPPLSFGLLAPLGVGGLVAGAPWWRFLWPVYGIVLAYGASCLSFFVVAEYRYPVALGLILAAAWFIPTLAMNGWRRREGAFGLAALALFVPLTYANIVRPDFLNAWRTLGHVHLRRQEPAPARRAFESAWAIRPDDAETAYNIGYAFSLENRSLDAIPWYRRSVMLDPRKGRTYNNLGNEYVKLGRLGDAAAMYRRCVEIMPDHPNAVRQLRALTGPPRRRVGS